MYIKESKKYCLGFSDLKIKEMKIRRDGTVKRAIDPQEISFVGKIASPFDPIHRKLDRN